MDAADSSLVFAGLPNSPEDIADQRSSETFEAENCTDDSLPSHVTHPYSPLKQTEIRLVEILPGDSGDPIALNINIVDLQKQPGYDALSYVWHPLDGTIDTSKPLQPAIIVNHQNFAVRLGTNLDAAIRHLRPSSPSNSPRVMWIDALCINQEDSSERNQQVGYMNTIYSSAQHVIIWLGPHHQDSEFVMKTLSTGHLSVEHIPRFIDRLELLLRRSWFGRVWIAQELTLAQNSPVIHLGSKTMEWERFASVIRLVRSRLCGEDDPVGTIEQNYLESFQKDIIGEAIEKDRMSPESIFPHPRATIARAEGFQHLADMRNSGRSATFGEQFLRTIYLRATDPRDQVYGLLGFSTFRNISITADYTKTTQEVFEEAVAVIIWEEFCIYVESQMWSFPRLSSSWVPDLQAMGLGPGPPSTIVPPRICLTDALDKARYKGPLVEFSDDRSTFSTIGSIMGHVTENCFIESLPLGPEDLPNIFQNLGKQIPNVNIEALLDTLLGTRNPLATKRELLIPVLQDLLANGYLGSAQDDPHVELFKDAMQHHKPLTLILRTDTNVVGITTALSVSTGTALAGLFGINLPFLMEHVEDDTYKLKSIVHIGHHELVDSHAQGLQPDADLNRLPGKLQRFFLR